MKDLAGREALIVGSGPDVEEEAALARRYMPQAAVIGVNYGAAVIEPDILFSNHGRDLREIARRIREVTGWEPELHTTPLPQDRKFCEGMNCWPDAYRKMVGSGFCAALMARLMGFRAAVLVGCPETGGPRQYWSRRKAICIEEHKGERWPLGMEPVKSKAYREVAQELKGFATSTSGRSRDLLGQPGFMTGNEPWLT